MDVGTARTPYVRARDALGAELMGWRWPPLEAWIAIALVLFWVAIALASQLEDPDHGRQEPADSEASAASEKEEGEC